MAAAGKHDGTRAGDRLGERPFLLREAVGPAFRLIGVGVSGFAPLADADPFDLADPDAPRRAKLEDAVDDLRERFGPNTKEH